MEEAFDPDFYVTSDINEAMNDVYEATNELRFVWRKDCGELLKVLQQKWVGIKSGEVEWRDVPFGVE